MGTWYDDVIDGIIKREAGYVNKPSDRGGETKYGITVAVARENQYKGPMADLPLGIARGIYFGRYIGIPKFDAVYLINPRIGKELVDTGVNMGPAIASMFLQRWLNAFNLRGRLYPDLFADGRIGNVTLDALRNFLQARGPEGADVLLEALNSIQGNRYLEIAEHDTTQEDFIYGQMRARVMERDL